MNSYPSQWNQMPAAQYFYPSWEAVSPQMKEDQTNSSCNNQIWPHSYGYPAPVLCHNCCSHGQPPAYYNFRPPCSHIPPPPPPACHHFYGGYPPYPQPYPMYYAPPPHYSMDLPRYEYEKSVPKDQSHCCGCLNHPCQTKGRNNVRIEEHEPDVETKKSEASFPTGANNKFPYPVMWIPPEYTTNKEQPRRLIENETNHQHESPNVKNPQLQWIPVETESKKNDGSSLDRKPHKGMRSADQDPDSGYGWIPLDINKIKQLMEGENAKHNHDQETRNKDDNKAHGVENKGENKQLSYPIFWMPYDRKADDSSEGQVEKTDGGVAAKESLAHNVVPRETEHTNNKLEKQRTAAAGDDDGRIGAVEVDKKRKVRTIPVKQLEDSTPKEENKEEENKQDAAKNTTNAQSASITKKSKLPPICLRVDPPKKKTVGGSSRSSSPPGDKKRQDKSSSERKCQQLHKEIKVKDAEDKTPNQHKVEVSHGAEENENASKNLKDQGDGEDKTEKQAASDGSEKAEPVDCRVQAQESLPAKQEACQQESKQDRKVMSETEAAVTIQTVYRGHDVRRSEPIKKLKEIAQVHEEAIKLKKHLEDLQSHPGIDENEKLATGEAIMKLLLKLDTIQGLHQSIRDVRRSVAKELIILQEKLDSLESRESDTSASQVVEEPSTGSALVGEPSTGSGLVGEPSTDSGVVEEPSKDSGLVEGSEVFVDAGESIKDSSLDGDKSTKVSEGGDLISSELCSTQPLPCQDVVCGSENKEIIKEPAAVNIESQRESYDDIMVSSTGSEEDVAEGLGLKMEEDSQNDLGSENKDQDEKLLSEPSQEVDIEDVAVQNDLTGNKGQDENLLFEQPEKVNEESLVDVSIIEDTAVQNDMVAGNEDQETDNLLELLKEDAEDEKDIQLTEHKSSEVASLNNEEKPPEDSGSLNGEEPCEDADSACKVESIEQDVEMCNLPLEVINDNGKGLTEVETSRSLFIDQEMDHPSENQEEDVVIKEHENHEPIELSSEETLIGQEGESNTSPTNIDIAVTDEGGNRVQESAGEEVDKMDEVSPQEEEEVEVTEGGPEIGNAKCSPRTISLLVAGDQVNKYETVERECPNDDGSSELSYEDQGSVVVGEKDDQTDNKKILEENEKLRGMLEKLLAAGKEQQEVISSLNGKVKDLEKKLRKKKVKSAKHPRVRVSRHLCGKPASGSLGERPMGIAS